VPVTCCGCRFWLLLFIVDAIGLRSIRFIFANPFIFIFRSSNPSKGGDQRPSSSAAKMAEVKELASGPGLSEGNSVSTARQTSVSESDERGTLSRVEKAEDDARIEDARRRSSYLSNATNATDDTEALSPLEEAVSHPASAFQEVTNVRTTTSIGSSASRPPNFEVVFEEGDPEHPINWPKWYRGWVIFCISYTTWVVVFYSTAYTASIPGLMLEFDVSSQPVATLGVTTYLLGLAVGSLIVAPASELYGRRLVYIACMVCFTLLVIPCCLASSLEEIIVVRFFGYVRLNSKMCCE
jgi:hypothetical protein